MSDPRVEYLRRLTQRGDEIRRGERASFRISNARLAMITAAAAIALAVMRGIISSWWLAPPAVAFLTLVVVHARVVQRLERARRARGAYERGVARLDGKWAGTGPDGARFLDDNHSRATSTYSVQDRCSSCSTRHGLKLGRAR